MCPLLRTGGKENTMYFDPVEFGKRIALLRKAHGLTQESCSEELNISYEHLSKMERGQRTCSFDLLLEIAGYFNVSTDYLLTGRDYERIETREKLLDIISQLSTLAKDI